MVSARRASAPRAKAAPRFSASRVSPRTWRSSSGACSSEIPPMTIPPRGTDRDTRSQRIGTADESTVFHDDMRRTGRILVVEPDDEARALYSELLHRAGCEVVEASDGREALVKAFAQTPTLVVTETRLPMLDGYALCEVLRADP